MPRARSGRRRALCTCTPVLGAFSSADLRRADRQIDACPGPRRLVVQWVPHGFGQRSLNLGFCLWVARRARAGDRVDVVVHEPYLEFGWGPLRHLTMAVVHRLMTAVLLRAADCVWISTPAWESRLRPYALGRAIEMRWLPVPGCETTVSGAAGTKPIVATLGLAARRPLRHLRQGCGDAARGTLGWGDGGRQPSRAAAAGRRRRGLCHAGAGPASPLARPCARHRLLVAGPARHSPDGVRPADAAVSRRYHRPPHQRDGGAGAGPRRGDHDGPPDRATMGRPARGGAGGRRRCRSLHREVERLLAICPRAGIWKQGRAPPTKRTFPWTA